MSGVIKFFTAPWCGTCHIMKLEAEKAASKFKKELEVIDLTTMAGVAEANEFMVKAIPQLIYVKNNDVRGRLIGYGKASKINFIRRHEK